MFAHDLTRREFLGSAATAGAALAMGISAGAAPVPPARKIIAFTKPFRELGAEETAKLVAEVGWDGVELPVRSKDGQILPQRVAEDLPKFVEALRGKGREVSIVTTEITQVDAAAEKVLRTASKLGIKRYRLGFYRYANNRTIPQQLAEIAPRLRDLAALNKELGLQAGFQNHSGNGYVGAAIWDIWTMIKDLDPARMGYCFDIGHATLEAGQNWPTNFRLAEPWLTAVFVKDFYWQKTDKGWKTIWCPLGQGMVAPGFFKTLQGSAFSGPICQHHEYEFTGEPLSHYKQDLATLRKWLA
jgi:sugar phosphate isomerase/epimerase